jgi:hypothetical protein
MNYYVEKRGANHGLHLVLTVLTCGLWAITGWPIAAIMGRKRTVRGRHSRSTTRSTSNSPHPGRSRPPIRRAPTTRPRGLTVRHPADNRPQPPTWVHTRRACRDQAGTRQLDPPA